MHPNSYSGQPCPYCKRQMNRGDLHLPPTRDHVVPACRGGRVKIVCCNKCNGIKADMMPEAWAAYMLANPGWWLLTRAERRARRRAEARQYEHPNGGGNYVRQGSPPMPPVVVPPELVFNSGQD